MDLERRGSEPFVDQSYVLQNPNYGLDVLSQLNQFRAEALFIDAILCVGAVEFPCHRNVLAVSSPYFRAMFSSDLKESKEGKISFNEISVKTLRQIIDYAYTGRVEITVDNAQEMLAAGSLFQYPAIVEACCEFLSRNLHASNCLGIEEFAQMHTCSKLEMEAHQYTLDNFSSVVEYEEFLDTPLERLITYLASDLIDVRNEEIVYDASLKWVHYDLDVRKQHLCTIMENIRLATIDLLYLEEVVEKDPLIQSVEQCVTLVEDAKKYHETVTSETGQRRRSMQTDAIQPRPSTVAKQVMVLVGGVNSMFNYISQSVEMYDPYKDKWHSLPDLPQNVSLFSTAAVENQIYVSGGIVEGQVVSTLWKFDSVQRQWSEVTSMLTPRARHASAAWNGKLYVLGGICSVGGDHRVYGLESIECYDVEKDEWSIVGHSPMPRKQSHLVPFKQTLVELGGTQAGARVKTMESYLCSENSVIYSGEQFVLPECIQFSQIVVLNLVFYIMWEDSKKVISLNPEKRTFRRLPDMHYLHVNSGATILNGKIYVTGGVVDSKPNRITECYDPTTNSWTIVKSMRQARARHGCVTIQMC